MLLLLRGISFFYVYMPKAQYILGVDIETGGPILGTHPLLAIGFSVHYWNGNSNSNSKSKLTLEDVIEVHMEADESCYEDDTLNWWKKQKDAWSVIKKDCVSDKEAAEKLVEFLKKWQKIAIDKGASFKIVTDNCWFDDTWVSWFLCVHGKDVGGLPLRNNYYTGYTKCSNMIDVNQRIQAASGDLNCPIGSFTPTVPHDHTPVSDSRGIVEKYVNYMQVTAKYRNRKTIV